jgi:hypothetical protein
VPIVGWLVVSDVSGALTVATNKLTATGTWPALALRGYGTVSAESWADRAGGTLLVMTCEGDEQAKLTQAKYLADLQTLPPLPVKVTVSVTPGAVNSSAPVTPRLRGAKKPAASAAGAVVSANNPLPVTAWQTADGGVIAALRDGRRVLVGAAASPSALAALLTSSLGGAWTGVESEATVSVPMWLDRWDRHSFRFYYGAFMRPKGEDQRAVKFYDPTPDYEFARKNGAGLILWTTPTLPDTAENIMKDNEWLFAFQTGRQFGLSLGLNTNLGDSPYWLFNRHPDWRLQYQPQFLGTYYGSMNFGIGELLSWCSVPGRDAALAEMQQTVKKYGEVENILTWLEPHGELGHGAADWLVEYGPVADADFRGYLQKQYGGELAKLNAAWDANFRDWQDIRVPEVASFLGWGPAAFDLTGEWKFSYDDYGSPQLADVDDSAWPTISAPGHALIRYLPRKPATFRRHFTLDASWSAGQKVWLYLWDLNDTRPGKTDPNALVHVWLNGQPVPEQPPVLSADHWNALEVSDLLRAGANTLTVSLPKGMFNYRAYLSPHEPRVYPDLAPGENARWADFALWNFGIRVNAVKRGLQMIRQADPNRGIFLMSPDSFVDGLLPLAREYLGDFHNTGYMAGWWCDSLPSEMRGARLPISVEPGGPAKTADELKKFFGNWLTEGVNGIDYFMHLGEVMWNPPIKQMFEDHIQVYGSAGRYHIPYAEVAALYSGRVRMLADFPWRAGWLAAWPANEWLVSGFPYVSPFNARKHIGPVEYMPALEFPYESDVVTESSFTTSDDPARFRVIIDAGSSTLDAATVSGIEKYVRAGGVFVVYGQTGRNTPARKDAWLLDELTGYRVIGNTGDQRHNGTLTVATGQEIFSPDLKKHLGDNFGGLRLEKTAPDATDLLKWKDGSVAVGVRPLGKGWFVYMGAWIGKGMPRLFEAVLQWRDIKPVPARLLADRHKVIWRHFVSNNGLYDVWMFFNQDREAGLSAEFELMSSSAAWAWDLQNNQRQPVSAGKFKVALGPLDTNIWLTPRALSAAPADWLGLQRDWWRAVTADLGEPLTLAPAKLAHEISDGWRMKILDDGEVKVSDAVQPGYDDSAWEQRRLGIYTLPDHPGAKRALFRREFTVPEHWRGGGVKLWLASRLGSTFLGQTKVYFDGTLLVENSNSVMGDACGGALQPGTQHTLAVEFAGEDALLGSRGETWLAWHPSPSARQDLSGAWEIAKDGLHWEQATLPGPLIGAAARQTVKIDAARRGQNVVVHADGDSNALRAIIINGQAVPRAHGRYGTESNINITPYVKFGADNEIILTCSEGDRWTVSEVSLEYHEPESYP